MIEEFASFMLREPQTSKCWKQTDLLIFYCEIFQVFAVMLELRNGIMEME